VPDTFTDANDIEVIVEGRLGRDGIFRATEVLAKCGSRYEAAYEQKQIGDVPAGNSHRADIEWLADRGITRGCNPPSNSRFCPGAAVTREQMAAFMVRALDLTETSGVRFRDVPRGSTFEQDIDRLATAGITRGCNPPANDRFCPKDFVTRAQMASFIARAKGYTETSNVSFRDVRSGSTHARAINLLATAGVTQGCDNRGNYCPDDFVTREQMASFLARAFLDDQDS
jgi:hypothetical protein